jgi:hypothetical protein
MILALIVSCYIPLQRALSGVGEAVDASQESNSGVRRLSSKKKIRLNL